MQALPRKNRLSLSRLERYYNTVWAIAASPYVDQYLIGLTARSAQERFIEYQSLEYDYLVVLADRLTLAQAKHLEKHLQTEVRKDKRHLLYKRYNEGRRGLRYYPSHGAGTADPYALIHSVYMAWWEP